VIAAARNIGRHASTPKVIVDKSTVPVGTADKVQAAITEELEKRGLPVDLCSVVSNPEFLKEGAAVEDFMRPDRIVIGTENTPAGLRAKEQMRRLYAPFNRHHERTYYMDVKSAELTKYAANAMLATRISFMNELANLADLVGADIEAVRQGIGSDSRIGFGFLYPGTGYGGSCFPKDVSALSKTAKEHGRDLKILDAVEAVNENQKYVLVEKIEISIRYLDNNEPEYSYVYCGIVVPSDDPKEIKKYLKEQLIEKLNKLESVLGSALFETFDIETKMLLPNLAKALAVATPVTPSPATKISCFIYPATQSA
jgi:nucleotide sugar dehydrogenase